MIFLLFCIRIRKFRSQITFLHPNTEISEPKALKMKNIEKEKEKQKSLIYRFIQYDDKVIRPKIIPTWPQAKEDNNNISRKIKKALGLWAEQKEKFHTYKENDTIGIDLPGFNRGNKNEKDDKEEELDKSEGKKKKKKIELQDIND